MILTVIFVKNNGQKFYFSIKCSPEATFFIQISRNWKFSKSLGSLGFLFSWSFLRHQLPVKIAVEKTVKISNDVKSKTKHGFLNNKSTLLGHFWYVFLWYRLSIPDLKQILEIDHKCFFKPKKQNYFFVFRRLLYCLQRGTRRHWSGDLRH